ncbi:hypothetical protein [Candidatus Thiodictyon syntrophicum]|jgi:hypothetical protein|uniref:hypothetical protein n=1 Tax=Candidatus Thiodictyon syntrophicum TaxID=1166950 RepID=UPI0012FD57BC|nr:hypothetical protein [Candidatus Thiodictyon syntrophicum]
MKMALKVLAYTLIIVAPTWLLAYLSGKEIADALAAESFAKDTWKFSLWVIPLIAFNIILNIVWKYDILRSCITDARTRLTDVRKGVKELREAIYFTCSDRQQHERLEKSLDNVINILDKFDDEMGSCNRVGQ